MRENQERQIRNLILKKKNHEMLFVNLESRNFVTLFIRDDEQELGEPKAIIKKEAGGKTSLIIEFVDGMSSWLHIIGKSNEERKMLRKFCNQQLISMVFVDRKADIQRVEGGYNPLFY